MRPSGTTSDRIRKSLLKAEKLTQIPIEVLISPGNNVEQLKKRIHRFQTAGLLNSNQALIALDPVGRNVVLGLNSKTAASLDLREVAEWLRALEEDLHMTHFENAVALAVLSLAMALQRDFPSSYAAPVL